MSEYNCRVKRVVPKDHILEIHDNPLIPYHGLKKQLGILKRPMGTELAFLRIQHPKNPGVWSKWALLFERSTWLGRRLDLGHWPDLMERSNIIHYRPQDQT